MWQMVAHFGHNTDLGSAETSDPIANMLRWINQHTQKQNVTVDDFSTSFQNGSAFAALMHSVTSLSIGHPAFPWSDISLDNTGLAGTFFYFSMSVTN
jgi:hypothetical protein